MLRKIIEIIKILVNIKFCWYCHKLQLGHGLCDDCWSNIIHRPYSYCPLCSNIYAYDICALCNMKIQVIFKYESIMSKLILGMKYNHRFYISDFLVNHINNVIPSDDYYILYIPHYPLKQITTAVNSSLLLAHSFQKRFGGKVIHNILIKKTKSRQKDSKNYEERITKPFNSYTIQNGDILYNKKIILIDDVIATGSTITRCASLIKRYKPQSIKIIIIAQSY